MKKQNFKVNPLVMGNVTVPVPIIQAGMGVQIAKADLAGAVAAAGGVGCISTVGLGTLAGSLDNYILDSSNHLTDEIRKSRKLAPNGVIAVNILGALSNFENLTEVCVREKVDMIITGAGLPLNLPGLIGDADIKLVPITSSTRALSLILRSWHRKHNRIPDAIIIEGPLCGGHMAFTWDDLENPDQNPIEKILSDVKELIAPYEQEYGCRIPIVGAGGIADSQDVLEMMKLGFDGVQVGTRFICTDEAGIHADSKKVFVNAKAEDVVLLHSPLGMPVKVLRTKLSEALLRGEKIPFKCPFVCLRACDAKKAKFCLADALVNTMFGDVDKGLFMTGSEIGRINDIIPAAQFIDDFRKLM